MCLQHIPVGLQASGVQGLVTVCECVCVHNIFYRLYMPVNSTAFLQKSAQSVCFSVLLSNDTTTKNNQANNLSTHKLSAYYLN